MATLLTTATGSPTTSPAMHTRASASPPGRCAISPLNQWLIHGPTNGTPCLPSAHITRQSLRSGRAALQKWWARVAGRAWLSGRRARHCFGERKPAKAEHPATMGLLGSAPSTQQYKYNTSTIPSTQEASGRLASSGGRRAPTAWAKTGAIRKVGIDSGWELVEPPRFMRDPSSIWPQPPCSLANATTIATNHKQTASLNSLPVSLLFSVVVLFFSLPERGSHCLSHRCRQCCSGAPLARTTRVDTSLYAHRTIVKGN